MEICGSVAHNPTHSTIRTTVSVSADTQSSEFAVHLHKETGRDGAEKSLPGFLAFLLPFKRDAFYSRTVHVT